MRFRHLSHVLALAILLTPNWTGFASPALGAESPPEQRPLARSHHALLVGVSRYPSLPRHYQLEGPANDVILFRKLLEDEFDFDPKSIVVLSEGPDSGLLPTRENITRELHELRQRVRPGDSAVLYLAGHGSRQPTRTSGDDAYPTSAREEGIFLARDASRWDPDSGQTLGAIGDRWFSAYVEGLLKSDVSLWFVVDACQSEGLVRIKLRGTPEQVSRTVPPAVLGIPQQIVPAQDSAVRTRGVDAPSPRLKLSTDLPGLSAMYACRRKQSTPEVQFQLEGEDSPRVHGLFTYTLCDVLYKSGNPLTYSETIQEVALVYAAAGRSPTPLVEGKSQDLMVLGRSHRRTPIRLKQIFRERSEPLSWIDAGKVHGLTHGTVLAVHPLRQTTGKEAATGSAPETVDAAPIGYVQISKLDWFRSDVVPCDYDGVPERPAGDLGRLAACVPVRVGFVEDTISLLVDDDKISHELSKNIRGIVEDGVFGWRIVDGHTRSHNGIHLEIAEARSRSADAKTLLFRHLSSAKEYPIPIRDGWQEQLRDYLRRVERVNGLLQAARAARSISRTSPPLQVDLELTLHDPPRLDLPTEVSRSDACPRLLVGKYLGAKIHNRESLPVDVTLLFVDADFGIHTLIPRLGTTGANRLYPGETEEWGPRRIKSDTVGIERLVLIAVRGSGDYVDFRFLAQPTMPELRHRGDMAHPLESPLARLFRHHVFRSGASTGFSPREPVCVHVRQWETVLPDEPAADQ